MKIYQKKGPPVRRVFTWACSMLLLLDCSSGGDGAGGLSPQTGGQLEAEDGATLTFPTHYSEQGAEGKFEKVADAHGEVAEDRKNISAEYQLTLSGQTPI